MVRAKFEVTAITKFSGYGDSCEITLEPRYDQSIPEDQQFNKATPTGKLTMWVNNPAAIEELKLGRKFYLDFNPVEEESQ